MNEVSVRPEYSPFLRATLDSVWLLTSTVSLSLWAGLPDTNSGRDRTERHATCSEKGSEENMTPFTFQMAETVQTRGDIFAWRWDRRPVSWDPCLEWSWRYKARHCKDNGDSVVPSSRFLSLAPCATGFTCGHGNFLNNGALLLLPRHFLDSASFLVMSFSSSNILLRTLY